MVKVVNIYTARRAVVVTNPVKEGSRAVGVQRRVSLVLRSRSVHA
jgi:hypothetical protein